MIARRVLLLGALVAPRARAEERPPSLPRRDVDVTYIVPTPNGGATQRLRVAAARGLIRIDPPGGRLFIIIDTRAERMFTVSPADRGVIDIPAPRAWMPGMGHGHYIRRNATQVSGVACTEWQTTDSEGRDVLICLDGDGVMLRADRLTGQERRTMAIFATLKREPQPANVFAIPASYRRLAPPPAASAR